MSATLLTYRRAGKKIAPSETFSRGCVGLAAGGAKTTVMEQISVWELMGRAIVVFAALLALFRIAGKRHLAQMSPFDLVVILLISEAVQGSLTGGDRSIAGGLISAIALVSLAVGVGHLTWRNRAIERAIDGAPIILIRNGCVDRSALAHHRITMSELRESLRKQGCTSVYRVRFAILENDGTISMAVRKRPAVHSFGRKSPTPVREEHRDRAKHD